MSARGLWPLRRDEALAAVASAALFTVAFPPFPLLAPALICLVPITAAIARADGARDAARLGFWFGLLAYGASVHWIAGALSHFTRLAVLGYLAAIIAAGMLVALAAAVLSALHRRSRWPMALLLPLVWVAYETMMANLPEIAFPWLPLGLATAGRPVLAQLADVSGVRGVSFVLAAVNGLFVDAWLLRADARAVLRRGGAAALLLLAMAGYGVWRMRTIEPRPLLRVATVQPAIAPDRKWMREHRETVLATLATLTREAAAEPNVALIVWPEAALPDWIQSQPQWLEVTGALARESAAPILFGALWREDDAAAGPAYYNAALFADASGRVALPPYRKQQLVPLIERTPFLAPRRLAALPYFGGYSRGSALVFAHPAARLGPLICYESIFAGRAREYRRADVDLLVNITNDAWLGRTLAPWQHEAHVVLRAIETRVGVVRAANTGFSGYVDPLGRIAGRTRLFEPAVSIHETATTDVITPYVRFGDWVGTVSAATVVAALAFGALASRRAA